MQPQVLISNIELFADSDNLFLLLKSKTLIYIFSTCFKSKHNNGNVIFEIK